MDASGSQPRLRVALLFTRYPVVSETFLQREVQALRGMGLACTVLALWTGGDRDRCAEAPDHQFTPAQLLPLLWRIPLWAVRNPRAMTRLAAALLQTRIPNATNFFETLLGLGHAISMAHALAGRCDHLHAAWASAPATAAWALSQLTGISWSMAGHAYDLYEDGGDGLLELKMPEATFIRTSTDAGKRRWTALGAAPARVHVIRRGLLELPPFVEERDLPPPPWRLLTVGRLVEKMGHARLLEVLRLLHAQGFPFTATIVGGGPLEPFLRREAARLGLAERVTFTGTLPHAAVEERYRTADLFLFCGRVAGNGDRAGFPNAVGEAMAWGVPVCAARVGAVTEGITDADTGLLFDSPAEAAHRIRQLFQSPQLYAAIRRRARRWAERHYDARRNMRQLAELFAAAAVTSQARSSPASGK